MLDVVQIAHGEASQRVTSPRYRWDCSNRGDVHFVIVQLTHSGEGYLEFGGQRHRVGAGHAFVAIVPEPLTYGYPEGSTEPWVFSWMNFYGAAACELFRGFRETFGCVVPLGVERGLAARFRDLASSAGMTGQSGDDSGTSGFYTRSAQAYGFVMDWCDSLRQSAQTPEGWVEVMRHHIESRFYEPGNIKSLAARFGVSREHFTREYRAKIGRTPADHLRECRSRAARDLLERADLPVSEVARRAGFSDAKHLRRTLGRDSSSST